MQEQEVIIHREPTEIVIHKPSPGVQDDEFLKNYEIKNWDFSPRIYKILAASAIFNILALLVFAQTNILQARACDSPWVGRVCQVIDTVYLGSTILNTDGEYVSKDYEKTELEDAEIVWINQTGNDPITYPEGYFALANPESQFQTMMQDPTQMPSGFENYQNYTPPANNFTPPTTIPIPPSSSGLQPQKLPPAATNPITIPDNPIGDNPIGKNSRKGNKNANPENNKPDANNTGKNENKDDSQSESKQPDIKSDAVKEVEINKKPFEDLTNTVLAKRASPQGITFDKPFKVALNGSIDEKGKLDKNKSRFVPLKDPGDEEMVNLAKSAIEALGDSNLLLYLRNIEIVDVSLELSQDDKQIIAVIKSPQKTPEKAKTTSTSFNNLITLAFSADEMGIKKLGDDEKVLLRSAKSTSNGKEFILNFAIPKEAAQEMINRKLDEAKAKKDKEQQQPNSTAQTKNADKTAGK